MAENAGKRGRPGRTEWLNQRHVLFVCTKSEAPLATEVTIQMVDVFNEYLTRQIADRTATLRPGHFRLQVGAREMVVDASSYQIGNGQEAVVCSHHDGKLAVMRGPLQSSSMAHEQGKRTVVGPWQKKKVPGALRERGYYTVLGRVVSGSEVGAKKKPVRVKAHRRALPKPVGGGPAQGLLALPGSATAH